MLNELKIPERVLMGPGPSGVHPRVLQSMALPLLGHLDPAFLEIMNDIKGLLRMVFGTENELTVPMSGTGSAGMETVFVNLVEPGDKVIVCVKGLFGQRMVDMAKRCGAEVVQLDGVWGDIIKPEQVREALVKHPDTKIVSIVHAETSTGVLQPLEEISQLTHEAGALLLVDTVTSLGGSAVNVDKIGIDATFSGTQKCLSAPPGLAPVTLGDRAVEALINRKSPVQSWYLDLSMVRNYWNEERFYHHTAPITMNYGLREALRMIEEEGLDNSIKRHQELGALLQKGLEELGLELVVAAEHRLPQLTVVRIPEGVSDTDVRGRLLKEYGIEIGGGLGEFKGKVWRIGLMGHSCSQRNVTLVLAALKEILG